MRSHITIILIIICVMTGCIRKDPRADLPIGEALQAALDGSIEGSGVIGVSAAVVLPDGEMWTGASGISHEGVPVTPGMLFDIGSIEKHFQAALTLKLVEDGVIGLDDTVGKWLPPYPNIDGSIDLHQLLGMTSGLDNFVEDAVSPWRVGYLNIDFEKYWSWGDIYDTFIGEPRFRPGTKVDYSTTNFIVLKHIIEKATGRDHAGLFREHILSPFGLNHTIIYLPGYVPDSLVIAHGWADINADGVADDLSGYPLDWIASLSPMLTYSTPTDMARWMDSLFRRGAVLNGSSLDEMLRFRGPVQREPMMRGYGLGLIDFNVGALLPRWKDLKAWGHGGSQFGFSTMVFYFPELETSVSLMFNRGCDNASDMAMGMVGGAFLDCLLRRLGVKESGGDGSPADLKERLKEDPGNAHLMYEIARHEQRTGKDGEAFQTYRRMLEADPDDMYGYRTRALFWKAAYEASIDKKPDSLIEFIESHPEYPSILDAYLRLAETWEELGDMERALATYVKALEIGSDNPTYLNNLAWWIYEKRIEEEYGNAIAYTKRALELSPDAASIWDTLACLYYETGKRRMAGETAAKALSLAPDDNREYYEEQAKKLSE